MIRNPIQARNFPQPAKDEISPEAKQMWDAAKRGGGIEYTDEQQVFKLTPKEAEKCRFEITDNTQRLAECTVHHGAFSHGVRLHPPHLYDLRDGKVYFKEGDKWVRWVANVEKNKERLLKLDE